MDPFLPTSSRETPRRNLWRYVGGFVAGGAPGVGVLLWFVGVIQPSYGRHYDALGPLVLAVFGSPVAGLIGGILGLVWAYRMGRTEDIGRAIRRSALIAVGAIAVPLIALPFLRQIA